jgi:hypothetical protein
LEDRKIALAKQALRNKTVETLGAREETKTVDLGDPDAGFCLQYYQQQCRTCKPGYMNLIVDMKE